MIAVKSHHGSGPCGLADCPVRLSAALSLPHCDALPSTYTLMSAQELGVLRRTYCRLHCASECAAKAVGAPAPAAPPPPWAAPAPASQLADNQRPPAIQYGGLATVLPCGEAGASYAAFAPDGLISDHTTEHLLQPWRTGDSQADVLASTAASARQQADTMRKSRRNG